MNITEKIKTIEQFKNFKKLFANDKFLFRGESQEFDKISSGLYRFATSSVTQYITPINADITIPVQIRISPQNLKKIQLEIQNVQENLIKGIIEYTEAKKISNATSFSMEYIQHYGGKTNFIDLTHNFEIAAYFACSKDYDKDGRIVLIKNTENYNRINLYEDPRFTENRRIQKQEGILIEAEEGFINYNDCEKILIISREIKKEILERLEVSNINEKSIYPDEGDIETSRYIEQLETKFYEDFPKHLQQAEKLHLDGWNRRNTNRILAIKQIKEAIEEYGKAIKINPDNHAPHTLKASVLLKLYDLTGEKSHAVESLKSCDMSIKLNPMGEEPLLYDPRFKTLIMTFNQKGIAYRIKGTIFYKLYKNYYLALRNLNKAIEINPNESQAYYRRGLIYCIQYESSTTKKIKKQKLDMAIKDFEKQIDVTAKQKENFIYSECLKLKNEAIIAKNALTESESRKQ